MGRNDQGQILASNYWDGKAISSGEESRSHGLVGIFSVRLAWRIGLRGKLQYSRTRRGQYPGGLLRNNIHRDGRALTLLISTQIKHLNTSKTSIRPRSSLGYEQNSQPSSGRSFGYQHKEKIGAANRTIFTELGPDLDEALAENESKNLLIAGTDTTVVTLSYLIWIVLRHATIKQKVLDEIATLPTDYSIAEAEKLSYTQNVLQESLRLYGAGPGSLSRTSPTEDHVLGGHVIPAGTILSTQAYIPHRDESVFVNATA